MHPNSKRPWKCCWLAFHHVAEASTETIYTSNNILQNLICYLVASSCIRGTCAHLKQGECMHLFGYTAITTKICANCSCTHALCLRQLLFEPASCICHNTPSELRHALDGGLRTLLVRPILPLLGLMRSFRLVSANYMFSAGWAPLDT